MTVEDPAWEDLQVLLAAMEAGSLSAAAENLGLGQSTVSRRLARLEELLGARLLDRTPEGVRPTELAERLVPHAELISEHMANIQRVAAGEREGVRGRVRLALPDGLASTWLMPLVGGLLDTYPDLELDLVMGNAVVDLVRREADLALRFVPPTHPELLVRRLVRLPMRLYVHPQLAEARLESLRILKLLDPPGLFAETQWIRRHAKACKRLRVSNWNALFAGVCEGVGAGILSPAVAEPAGLIPFPGVPGAGHRDLLMVYHPAMREVPRVVAVRDWLLQNAPVRIETSVRVRRGKVRRRAKGASSDHRR